jgi:hypothetical protein
VAVWEDDRTSSINVYLSRRDPENGGTPWTPNVRVNAAGSPPSGSYFMNPSVAVLDEVRYFVAWTDWREGAFHQVYMRGTRDAGATWSAETRISDEIGYEPVAADPCLVGDRAAQAPGSEVLHCVMNDWRGNVPGGRYPDVFHSRTTDGGASWSNGVRINDVTQRYQQVSSRSLVLLPDGTLTAGWLDSDAVSLLRTCRSTDSGATWSASVRVDDPALGGVGTYSSIASAGPTVFASFFCYQTSWDLFFRPSYDGGRTWGEPVVRIDDDGSGGATQNPVLAARSETEVCAAWMDTRPGPGPWKIYAARGVGDVTAAHDPEGGAFGGSWSWVSAPNPSRAGRPVTLQRVIRAGASVHSVRPAPGASGIDESFLISDASGRLVRRLPVPGSRAPGVSRVVWDGRDDRGNPVGSGVFWARLLRGTTAETIRLVRVR